MRAEASGFVDAPMFGRFTRRVQGVFIDSIVLMLILVGAVCGAVTLVSDHVGRTLGVNLVVTWLLYEPLLVSQAGGTIGHYVSNLRVVDDRRRGNIGLAKAVLRVIIKTFLGWFSLHFGGHNSAPSGRT